MSNSRCVGWWMSCWQPPRRELGYARGAFPASLMPRVAAPSFFRWGQPSAQPSVVTVPRPLPSTTIPGRAPVPAPGRTILPWPQPLDVERPERRALPPARGGGFTLNWGQVARNVPGALTAGLRGGPTGLLTGLLSLFRGTARPAQPAAPAPRTAQQIFEEHFEAAPESEGLGIPDLQARLQFSRGLRTLTETEGERGIISGGRGVVQTIRGPREFVLTELNPAWSWEQPTEAPAEGGEEEAPPSNEGAWAAPSGGEIG